MFEIILSMKIKYDDSINWKNYVMIIFKLWMFLFDQKSQLLHFLNIIYVSNLLN